MRAAWYEKTGPARDVLQVGDMADPEPARGEVLVKIAASGANPSDWKSRTGFRPMAFPRIIPHSDGAGIIARVGEGVLQARVGERVWVWNGQWKRPFGTAAELIAVPAQQAVRLPDNTSFEAGACFGIPALTAHRAVTTDGSPAGQTVLINGGAGAVGHYAIQFAKLLGAAKIITTVSSADKAKHAKAAGADEVIDYKTENVVDRVMEITGRGVDRIVEVDAAGNADKLPRMLARDGLIAVYGTNAPKITFDFWPMILCGAAVRFFMVYELPDAARAAAIGDLTRWMEAGKIQHTIAAEFSLDKIAEAHEAVEQGKMIGNVVVKP